MGYYQAYNQIGISCRPIDILYYSIQLFFLQFRGDIQDSNVYLDLARYLAPLIVILSVLPILLLLSEKIGSSREFNDYTFSQKMEIQRKNKQKHLDVFISYQNTDKTIADAICSNLENKKIKCWYAPRDIPPGADWQDSIKHAIKLSKLVVIVWSNNTQKSKMVRSEVTAALDEECIIIPFRIDKVEPSGGWSLLLNTTHWLDAYDPPLERRIDELGYIILTNLRESD